MVFELQIVSLPAVFLRLGLASIFGFVMGWERQHKGKPMGSATYLIVAVTTTLLAIAAQELSANYGSSGNAVSVDLGKVIAGALTGIGFLGAGAIIKDDQHQVIGTATGASIWASGALGLILGFGFYSLSIMGFIVVMLALTIVKRWSRELI